jgi:hypothetical protein
MHRNGGRWLFPIALLSAAAGFALSTGVLISSANAQTAYCWINSATGQPVPPTDVVPQGSQLVDSNHAVINSGPTVPGATFFRVSDGS